MTRILTAEEILDIKIALRFTALNDSKSTSYHKLSMAKLATDFGNANCIIIQTEKEIQQIKFLRADRSWCNESEGKKMFGCFARDGIVLCYVSVDTAAVEMCKFFGIKYEEKVGE